ncbi:hypothetical protein HMPREF9148_01690 [Prevotella sp. F0091]|nr:hypothetical protein HMPREF9148_01690 [Prevotella sp. F0091]
MFICYSVLSRKQLVHLSTCSLVNLPIEKATCSYVTLSYLASNLFTCQLVHLSTCSLVNLPIEKATCSYFTLSYLASNLFTCQLVNLSTRKACQLAKLVN